MEWVHRDPNDDHCGLCPQSEQCSDETGSAGVPATNPAGAAAVTLAGEQRSQRRRLHLHAVHHLQGDVMYPPALHRHTHLGDARQGRNVGVFAGGQDD